VTPGTSAYIHGTAPEEQRRLAAMNDMINADSLALLAIAPGERVLDVGAGLGQLSRAMARAAGGPGRVVGVERSDEQRAAAMQLAGAAGEEGLVDFRGGDAAALPLTADEWGTFDVVHTRFLLEHVPHPEAVVAAMARAVRPGGRVVLEDDDHAAVRLWPEPPGFREAWEAYTRTYDRHGNDPYVGRRLVALLHGAGLVPTRIATPFFGGCVGQSHWPALVENIAVILEGARDPILATGARDPAALDAAIAAVRAWGRRPDAAAWYTRCWAEGRRVDEVLPGTGTR
jgi:ubiquinone/menaquinone biosynthesis C-methylase UbiE